MRRLFLTVIMILTLAGIGFAQSDCTAQRDYIEVSGTAELEREPDMAIVNIRLSESDVATKDIDSAERKMVAIINKLGLNADKNLTINSMNSTFVKRKNSAITKSYTLDVADLSKLSSLLSKLDEEGIANVNIARFKYSKIASLRDEVRALAVKNGVAKAKVLTDAAEISLGKVIRIQDTAYEGNSYAMPRMLLKSASGDDVNNNIDIEKIKVSSSVNIRLLIGE